MLKLDFIKEHRDLYTASAVEPSLVQVPALNFLMVLGQGDPNTSLRYQEAVEALFSLSYTLKFMIKKGPLQIDYKVMPLEGLWWIEGEKTLPLTQRDNWRWIAMIMQPTLVTPELLAEAKKQVAQKRTFSLLADISLGQYEEGLSAQILHKGPYSEEGGTIEKLHRFLREKGYEPAGKHHEIYLNDPRKTQPPNLKTIIRLPVKKAAQDA